MVQLSTNISNISVADTAYSNFYNQSSNTLVSLDSYLENIDILTVIGNPTSTNSVLAGTLSNGDYYKFIGSNLLNDTSTITTFSYTSNQGIELSASGTITITESTNTISGAFNNITVQDYRNSTNITYSYSGSFTFNNFTTSTLNISTTGFNVDVNGNLIEDDFGNQSGVINSLEIIVNGQTAHLQNLSLNYSTFDKISSYSNLLSYALSGNDNIVGSSGNETLVGYAGDDFIDGGAGTDTALFNFNQSDITLIRKSKLGNTISIAGANEGTDTITNIEIIQFLDGSTLGIDAIVNSIATLPTPTFSFNSNGKATTGSVTVYSGPVGFLEYQSFGNETNEVVVGSRNNDFINLFAGDDAADGGDGDDVLDGGIGSNFLVGGNGNDTFFLDGRGGTVTWSTITDFSSEEVNIWGWVEGVSKLLLTDANGGVAGFTGATFHYDLNNDGTIDTSITFSGLEFSNVPTAIAGVVADNGYLLIA